MDQYFMDLYRTRLYLLLVFLILAYVVSPQFRRIFTKAGRWIDGRKTWQAVQRFLFFCVSASFIPGKAGVAISSIFLHGEDTINYQQYLQDHSYVRLENADLEGLEEKLSFVFSDYDNH